MQPNKSDVIQLVPETIARSPRRLSLTSVVAGTALLTGAFGMAFSALLLLGGPHVGYILAGTTGFIGCAVLVTAAVITISIASDRAKSGTDAPTAAAYAVLAGGLLTMLLSASYGATSVRLASGEQSAMALLAGGGGFIAGAVLVAGGLIGAGFRSRTR